MVSAGSAPQRGAAAAGARFYLRVQGLWSRVLVFVDATFTGLWLGLLSRRALHALDEETYRRWPLFASEAHNLSGLVGWEEKAYAGYLAGRRRIVVLGAGGGREAIALARRGHEVVAYECHPDLLGVGQVLVRREAPGATLEYLPRDEAPRVRADAVLVGWSAYMLVIGRQARIALLRGLAQLLPPGGTVVVSFFERQEGSRREWWVARVAGAVRWLRHGPPVEEGDYLGPNWHHRFTRREIEAEFQAAGLVPVAYESPGTERSASGWAAAVRPDVAPG